ncbi:hypothetical protein NL676_019976 [Syzygium grande]|nr:hypothetical protein NL676_019976 [Syzygium grande]
MDLRIYVAFSGGRYYGLFDHARGQVMHYYNEGFVAMFDDFLAVGVEQIRVLYNGVDPCIRTVESFVINSADPLNLEI